MVKRRTIGIIALLILIVAVAAFTSPLAVGDLTPSESVLYVDKLVDLPNGDTARTLPMMIGQKELRASLPTYVCDTPPTELDAFDFREYPQCVEVKIFYDDKEFEVKDGERIQIHPRIEATIDFSGTFTRSAKDEEQFGLDNLRDFETKVTLEFDGRDSLDVVVLNDGQTFELNKAAQVRLRIESDLPDAIGGNLLTKTTSQLLFNEEFSVTSLKYNDPSTSVNIDVPSTYIGDVSGEVVANLLLPHYAAFIIQNEKDDMCISLGDGRYYCPAQKVLKADEAEFEYSVSASESELTDISCSQNTDCGENQVCRSIEFEGNELRACGESRAPSGSEIFMIVGILSIIGLAAFLIWRESK